MNGYEAQALRLRILPQLRARIDAAPQDAYRVIREVAALLNIDPSTPYRWTKHKEEGMKTLGRPTGSTKFTLTEDLVALYYAVGSNAAMFRKRAIEMGLLDAASAPHVTTIRREIKNQIPHIDRVLVKAGQKGVRNDANVYLPIDTQYRTATFAIDHCELPVWVIPPFPYTNLRKAWFTGVMDVHTRVIMGFAISLQPNSSVIAAALMNAIAPHPEGLNPFQGMPSNLLTDNGKDFTSDHFMQVAVGIGATQTVHAPYSPHIKGRLERFHGTLRTRLQGAPGFAHGPETLDGKRMFIREDGYLHFSQMFKIVETIVEDYHNTVPSQTDLTPLQAWESDATPLRTVPNRAELAWMLMKGVDRKVSKNGIAMFGKYFSSPEISVRKGDKLEVRFIPHDHREIFLFEHGRYLGTAVDPDDWTDDEKLAYYEDRTRKTQEAKARVRKSKRRNRMVAHPVTGATAIPQVTVNRRPAKEITSDRPTKVSSQTEIIAFGDIDASYPEEA
jgi:putative transposase